MGIFWGVVLAVMVANIVIFSISGLMKARAGSASVEIPVLGQRKAWPLLLPLPVLVMVVVGPCSGWSRLSDHLGFAASVSVGLCVLAVVV